MTIESPLQTAKGSTLQRMPVPVTGGVFIPRLEALRGVASLMVAVYHSFEVLAIPPGLRLANNAVLALFNGHAAVDLFFVLSGLVLGKSLSRGAGPLGPRVATYAVRRFFRLYPAFVCSTVAIWWYYYHFSGFPQGYTAANEWVREMTPASAMTWSGLLHNLGFAGPLLNPVAWTLRVELICSLALPLVHLSTVAFGTRVILPWLVLSGVISLSFPNSSVGTYFFAFCVGYFIPHRSSLAGTILTRAGRFIWIWLFVLSVIFLRARYAAFLHGFGILLEGLAAAGLISTLLYGPELAPYKLLDHPIFRFAGRVSFSFYLVHLTVLLIVARLLFYSVRSELISAHPLAWGAALALISILAAQPISWCMYTFVELPGIEWGRRMTGLFSALRGEGSTRSG
jgi:peptidoglycan/LPS O-acetylase OafA/YrhL